MLPALQRWILLSVLLCFASPALAALEWNLKAERPLAGVPLDLALSPSDGRIFVLLNDGQIQMFAASGELEQQFSVGAGVTNIIVAPDGQRLLLGNARDKTLQIIDIDYVYPLPAGNSPVKGALDAPVTLTVFDDFQCPYCARLVPLLDQIIEAYPGQVRLVFKHFPLRMHKFAQQAAVASLAAREQGRFWEMHDQLFAHYNQLDDALVRELAARIGLDMARFERDLGNTTLAMEIAADLRLGQQAGVRGTPSLFLNGKPVQERTPEVLRQLIDQELEKLKARP